MIGAAMRRARRSRGTPLKRQIVRQTANQGNGSATEVKLQIASDVTHTAVVVDNNMIVKGSGPVTITLTIDQTGSIFENVVVNLRRNGAIVGSIQPKSWEGVTQVVPGVTLNDGDVLALWTRRIANSSLGGETRGVVLDITPA
ncbi:hypothetical protein SEA_CHERRYONLIM_31 [Gordonia phage CherryonLim]|uniref:Uncharacterized protein n=1 Tax=Gordonia phage CherryonLim TaxID=2652411 RepID=A0A5P8D9W1_9CAUD|nr:hypothetical protein PP994_gp31 [Gordonia phage CherryonLim]QFP95784.1 hypothetical protein SEA_CHERRYONLIM_31 [Gordonia phage CherryonLim]